ncbi:MAG: fatty acid desaturase [Bacteroidales bacterium]|nr:fatty acid desaturase [Bacteroidales bacterium]
MGVFLAILIIAVWGGHLAYILTSVDVSLANPWMYLHILLQTYFYTGLFITGHDAMHGTVSAKRKVNEILGSLAVFLFAGMSYKRLKKNHGKHHKYVATENDPDYYTGNQNFFVWWATFMWRYLTVIQIIIMAALYNIFVWVLNIPEPNVIVFWIVPAILGTLQLFYVGTFLPHQRPHDEYMQPHKARTQKKNHLWAMLSCYFFGYHYEHHESPRTPWWQLYKSKQ